MTRRRWFKRACRHPRDREVLVRNNNHRTYACGICGVITADLPVL